MYLRNDHPDIIFLLRMAVGKCDIFSFSNNQVKDLLKIPSINTKVFFFIRSALDPISFPCIIAFLPIISLFDQ